MKWKFKYDKMFVILLDALVQKQFELIINKFLLNIKLIDKTSIIRESYVFFQGYTEKAEIKTNHTLNMI